MGSYLTSFWWGGDPDILDPISGMSKRDIYIVRKTWTTVNAKSEENGLEILLRLFRKDPCVQKHFKNISSLPEDQVKESIVFKAHVLNLMAAFNNAVEHLNTPEVVVALMNKIGTSHRSRHIEIRHFEELKEILVEFFVMDMKLDATSVNSLHRFLTFILQHIYEKMKD